MRIRQGSGIEFDNVNEGSGWLSDKDRLRHDFIAPQKTHATLSKSYLATHPSTHSRVTAGQLLSMQLLGGLTKRRSIAEAISEPAKATMRGPESRAEAHVERIQEPEELESASTAAVRDSEQIPKSFAEAEETVGLGEAISTLQSNEAQPGSKDEEETYMVRLYKGIEQQSKMDKGDPAFEHGSRVQELPPDDPYVQHMMVLGKHIEASRRRKMAEELKAQGRLPADSMPEGRATASSAWKEGMKSLPSTQRTSQKSKGGGADDMDGEELHAKCCTWLIPVFTSLSWCR